MDDTADPLALENQVCFALAVAARTVISVYKPLLEPMNLTHPQYLVMLALWGDAPLSVTELSRLLELDPGTLSPLLKRLEAAGLIRRERRPEDERSVQVMLTDMGAQLRTRAEDVPTFIGDAIGLDSRSLATLRTTLGRLTAVVAASR
jgi:MarR family transcriptional regulator, organic hydroperoxide resistance regulator